MNIRQPPDDNNLWNFQLAHDFLRSFQCPDSPNEDGTLLDPFQFDPKSAVPGSLGDFNRLFEYCGWPVDPPSSESSSAQSDPPSTSESTAPDDVSVEVVHFAGTGKEVRWKDEAGFDLTESRRRSSQNVSLADDDSEQGDAEGPPTPTPTGRRARNTARKTRTRILRELLPASIVPPRVDDSHRPPPQFSPIPITYFNQHHILPLYTLTREEQEAKLSRKVRRVGGSFPGPIHVFMDCSNIMIGWYERLKLDRNMKGSAKAPPVSYRNLASILERGRLTDRRILVGSHGTTHIRGSQLPAYMREARKCGYELNILEPVIKPKIKPSIAKAKNGRGNGYATTSGHSSGSETFSVGALARAEQAVDELLQMKMLESLLDFEPATMVLASGDAAEAEYSGGFLKTVERALRKGWKVEVLAWKNGLSFEYRSTAFLERWKGQFRVIELDDFSEELLAVYTDVYPTARAMY